MSRTESHLVAVMAFGVLAVLLLAVVLLRPHHHHQPAPQPPAAPNVAPVQPVPVPYPVRPWQPWWRHP
jgi:hypothetical protein